MSVSVEQEVRAAATPGEALLILAQAIDELRSLVVLRTPASDPWAIPKPNGHDDDTPGSGATVKTWSAEDAKVEYARKIEALGERPQDPEDALAWDAAKNLLADLLKPPTGNVGVTHSRIERVVVGPDEFQIKVPKATDEQRGLRRDLAVTMGLNQPAWWTRNELALEIEDGLRAYELGGPLWLHAYDRDFVMQTPPNVRQAMVEDLMLTSPDDAFELGRDILKDTTPDGAKGVTFEWQERGAR